MHIQPLSLALRLALPFASLARHRACSAPGSTQRRYRPHPNTNGSALSTRCTLHTGSRKPQLTVAANASCIRWACHGAGRPTSCRSRKPSACSIVLSLVTASRPTLLPRRRAGVTSIGEQIIRPRVLRTQPRRRSVKALVAIPVRRQPPQPNKAGAEASSALPPPTRSHRGGDAAFAPTRLPC